MKEEFNGIRKAPPKEQILCQSSEEASNSFLIQVCLFKKTIPCFVGTEKECHWNVSIVESVD